MEIYILIEYYKFATTYKIIGTFTHDYALKLKKSYEQNFTDRSYRIEGPFIFDIDGELCQQNTVNEGGSLIRTGEEFETKSY